MYVVEYVLYRNSRRERERKRMEVGNRIKLMKKSREGQRQGAKGGHAGMKTGKEKQRKRGREKETETEGEKEV